MHLHLSVKRKYVPPKWCNLVRCVEDRAGWPEDSHGKYRGCAGSGATESSAVGLVAAMEEDREAFSGKRAEEAAERNKWRAEQRETLDELLPKAMGR